MARSLQQIEQEALQQPTLRESLDHLMRELKDDPRKASRALLSRYEKKILASEKESIRMASLWVYEQKARAKGAVNIAGVDEAGRGPLVGPVFAAAVILPEKVELTGLDDSKKLTPATRDRLFDEIQKVALAIGVASASALEIDEHNIYRASQMAMERAIEALPIKPDHMLLDAMYLAKFSQIPQDKIIHGDSLSATIAAASIVAKVTRDRLLIKLDHQYPQYGFASHKGYGTAEHLKALQEHGVCPEHRRTFGPVAAIIGGIPQDAGFDYWAGKVQASVDKASLEEVGKNIRVIGRKKVTPEEVEKLRDLYRKKRREF